MVLEKDADGFYSAPPPDAGAAGAAAEPEKNEEEQKADDPQKQSASDLLNSTFDVQVTLADQQHDPNSPLYSAKSFEELNLSEELLRGVHAMGFSRPSKIQEKALPLLLSSPPQNFIGQSQSGTGKTAAFVLTMLSRVDKSINKPQAICLAPSRELARQIMTVVTSMGRFVGITTEFAIKEALLKDASHVSAHIIVGTPGTAVGMLRSRVLDPSEVKVFVLDEADVMVDQTGLSDQTLRVKNDIGRARKGKDLQIILFSATFPEHVKSFADKFAPKANTIHLKANELNVDNIYQCYMDCKTEDAKYDVLVNLYHILTIGQSIIFCQHRHTADRISKRMTAEGHKVASLHGAKDASERDQIIDRFRDGNEKVLITTNVIARGIDIMQVNMVVNYDLPLLSDRMQGGQSYDMRPDVETYIHRIGRTGRFGRKGISINFVHDTKTWEQVQAIETVTGKHIPKIETGDLDEMEEKLKKLLK